MLVLHQKAEEDPEWFVFEGCLFVLFVHGWLLASEEGVVCFRRLYVCFRKDDWGENVWGFGAAKPSIPRCERPSMVLSPFPNKNSANNEMLTNDKHNEARRD